MRATVLLKRAKMRTERLLGMSRPVLTEIFEFQDEDPASFWRENAIVVVILIWVFLRVYINTDIRAVRLEKFVIVMIKQLIITITKFSNLIGSQLP